MQIAFRDRSIQPRERHRPAAGSGPFPRPAAVLRVPFAERSAKDQVKGARRNAAGKATPWKHGGYAEGFGQFSPPCKSRCPLDYPCAIRKLRDDAGLPTSRCLATSPDLEEFWTEEVRQVYEAVTTGDTPETPRPAVTCSSATAGPSDGCATAIPS
jgi:hypothetical protein